MLLTRMGGRNSSPDEVSMKYKIGFIRLFLSGVLVAVLGYLSWECFWWRRAAEMMADESGHGEAVQEFRRGALVLWETNPTNDFPRFSGRMDGPFQIWLVEYHPEIPGPIQMAQQRKFEAHNLQMRRMMEDPKKYKFGIDREGTATNKSVNAVER